MPIANTTMRERQYDFNFEGEIRAFERKDADGTTRYYIGGTASSTFKDLYGDVIAPAGQKKMLAKLRDLAGAMSAEKSGLTAFLNHRYTIPEDVLGAFTGATLTERMGDDGVQYLDLDIECRLVDFATNPRAEAAYKQIQDGIRHGWSIGAYFLEYDWLSPEPDDWGILVTDLDLMEISLVGLPANQRAWAHKTASLESLKALAVAAAETIAKDAATASKDLVERRSLVLKSLVPDATLPTEMEVAARAATPELATFLRARSLALRGVDSPEVLEERTNLIAASYALERRAADDGDSGAGTPDDDRDKIGMAMSFMAKAVGHGCCVKSAGHLSKALDCLAGAMAPSNPDDDDDTPATLAAILAAQIAKLQPKAGDTIVIRMKPEALATCDTTRLAADLKAAAGELEGINVLFTSDDIAVTVEAEHAARCAALESLAAQIAELTASVEAKAAELAAKQAEFDAIDLATKQNELATLTASVDEKAASLADVESKLAAVTTKLTELEAKIKEAADTPLGRRSRTLADSMPSTSESTVKPEHYHANATQMREALEKTYASSGSAPEARDVVAAQ